MNDQNDTNHRHIRLVLWGAFAVIMLLIVIMALKKKPEKIKPEIQTQAIKVNLMTITPRPAPDRITLPGHIAPSVEADLAPAKGGKVFELNADIGDRVKRGDVLMRIDDRLWQAVLHRAEIEQREATRDLERWKELEKAGAVSVSDFDAIRTRYDQAAVALEEARAHIDQCRIVSPIDGRVDQRNIELGEFATEGVAVFKVLDTDPVKLLLDIPEHDILSVQVGDKLPFRISVLPDRTFTARVTFVSSQASRSGNAFRCELEIDNKDDLLKPGMIAETELTRRTIPDAIVIPLASIIPRKGEYIVFVVKNGHAIRRNVHILAIHGAEAVLSDGLRPGEKLVIEGHRALVDGIPVEAEE